MRVSALLCVCLLLVSCGRSLDPATAVAEAQALIADGQSGEARILLKNALSRTPDLPGARQLLARIALDEGDAQTAGDELAAFDATTAATPEVVALKARVELSLGRVDAAARLLEDAGDAIPEPERTLLFTAVLRAQGKLADALILLRKQQQVAPADERFATEIAGTLAAMGNLTDAVVELDRYLAHPGRTQAEVLRARGNLRLRQGLPAASIADLRAALSAAPHDWPQINRLSTELLIGDALLAAGNVGAASEQIKLVDAIRPGMFGVEILKARVALLDGRAGEAADRLKVLAESAPDNERLQYLLVDALVQSGNVVRATELLERRVAAEPATSPARRMLAGLWMQQSRPDRVVQLLEGDAESQLAIGATDDLLAAARLARGRAGEAIIVLSQRLAADPGSAQARAELAAAQIANGEPGAALATLGPLPVRDPLPQAAAMRMAALLAMGNGIEGNRLVDSLLDPAAGADVATLLATADAAQRQRQNAMVSRLLDRAVKLEPDKLEVRLRSASLAFDARRYDDAERELQAVLKAAPGNVTASVALARVTEVSGKVDAARSALRGAILKSPQAMEPALMLASLELRAARAPESSKVLEALITARPDGTAANAAGLLLADANRLDEARTRFRQAIEQDADNAGYWSNLGRAQLALTDRSAARESFVKGAQLDSGSLPTAAVAVRLSLEQGDKATARRVADALVVALPRSATAWLILGETALAGADGEAARKAFTRANALRPTAAAAIGEFHSQRLLRAPRPETPLLNQLAREPEDIRVRQVLMEHHLVSGNSRAAAAQLEILIRQQPSDVATLNNLAWLLRESDNKRAQQLALQARAIAPDNPAVADTLGVIYLAAGQYDAALAVLAEAAAALPQNRAVQYHHALALRRTARNDAARVALQRALEGNVDFDERAAARRLMEEL